MTAGDGTAAAAASAHLAERAAACRRLLVHPANFLGFARFTMGPILFAFVLAFLHWDGSNPIRFADLENFWKLFDDRAFRATFWNTIIYTASWCR